MATTFLERREVNAELTANESATKIADSYLRGSALVNVTVPVPEERLADFYFWFAAWLRKSPATPHAALVPEGPDPMLAQSPLLHAWGPGDAKLLRIVVRRCKLRSQAIFEILFESRGTPLGAEEMAARLGETIHKIAGLMTHPTALCEDVQRRPFWSTSENAQGGASYWVEPDVCDLFEEPQGPT